MGGVQFALQRGLLALEQGSRNGLLIEAHLYQRVLAGFQLADELGLGSLDLAQGVLADFGQGTDSGLAALDTGGRHLHRGVMLLDGCLDQLRANVGAGRTGRAVDPAATKEVGVLAAVAAGRYSERQPTTTLAAEDAAPQVVLAHPRPLPGDALLIQQHLHTVKGVRVGQRLMPSLENLFVFGATLVDDLADVVAVAEQALDNAGAELLGHTLGSRAGTQAQPFQLGGKLGDGVFAASVELESQGYEMAAFGVDGHDGDPPPVRQFIDAIEIAQRGDVVSAADAGLLLEAALDALAGLHRLELVLGGDHALVEESGGVVLADHRLGDRDELGPSLAHQLAGLPVVALVARPARQAPDDDVLDTGCGVLVAALQLVQHL